MPFEIMDQRRLSFFSEELRLPSEMQVGLWKPESATDHRGMEGLPLMSGSKSVSSSPMEKLRPVGPSSLEHPELCQQYLMKDQKTRFGVDHHLVGAENGTAMPVTHWKASEQNFGLRPDLSVHPASIFKGGNGVEMSGLHYENSLFSSSLSELLDRNLKLSANVASLGKSVGKLTSNFEEEDPVELWEEIEAHTMKNLLPDDDDDLLSGVVDDVGYIAQPNSGDDIDDDIFCNGGGMELEGDLSCIKVSDLINEGGSNGLFGGLNNQLASEHPYGEHPSRTLFVRNINSSVEDAEIRLLFGQYGDIRTLYTACKHRGFIMVSYYDIRAARNAMKSLQNKPLRRRKLDIHFSIPKDNPSEKDINQGTLVIFNLDPSVSNDDLRQIFGVYGEIKEIRETPHKHHHKFIEYYDVRAADAALRALNRRDIAGKKIKLELSRPGGARRLLQQPSPELELEESSGCRQRSSPSTSPPGYNVFPGSVSFGAIPSGFDHATVPSLQSAIRAPINTLLESALQEISSSIPHSLSSSVKIAPVGNNNNLAGIGKTGHSFEPMKFGFQGLPIAHPQSLPNYHDGLTNGIAYNSSSTMPGVTTNINSRLGEGLDNRYMQRVGSGGLTSHFSEHNEGAFGAAGNGSFPVQNHQYILNNANAYPHHSSGPIIWGNSPSFMNKIPAHHGPQMSVLPGSPSLMLNNVLPLHHHVGSAPAVNPSIWDRRQPFVGDSLDVPTFHPGSLGSMGFSGSSAMHPLDLAHNIFPHAGRNCIDLVGIPSPQQRSNMLHVRNHVVPFDAPNDWGRSRRSEYSNGNQGEYKKQYELDIERILLGEDSRTTLMIKNIPNKYTSKMLLAAIDEQHKGTYDFIYLPIDFKNKCNVGYAFINMIEPQHIIPFFQAFNGKKWEKFNSEKVASLAYGRIQGKAALITHFQNSSLMNEDKRCRPILFCSDGPNAGDQEPFPIGPNFKPKPIRCRAFLNEESYLGSPSSSPTRAGCINGANIVDSAKESE